ncbi:uncharacterized protein [Paramisgurnus dabryanus]|uniref:uncharacterized protein n=1 Tax=Paramisgurnus dabryanus TaxID=90735 RepID=UPI003CCFBD2F
MPTIGSSKSPVLCNAKGHAINKMYSASKPLFEVNTNNPTSNIQEKTIPLKNMMCSTNSERTASCFEIGVSSLGQAITYDASEEDLMNAIEREFV